MNKQINSQQAAFLSYLVYTKKEKTNQYIFDNQEVTEGEKTLRNYIYDQDGNFRQGIPQELKDKINSQPDTFNKILDNFQLKDTTNSIDGAVL
ncbi:MAG: hypothetical protein O2809_06575 [Proteobacteria bacterium]|nr:hypothetical protein [Pseudomonadota bacterium]